MRRTAALLLILSTATACRVAEQTKRAAASAVTSFVLQTVLDLQGQTPLTQGTRGPAPQANGREWSSQAATDVATQLCAYRKPPVSRDTPGPRPSRRVVHADAESKRLTCTRLRMVFVRDSDVSLPDDTTL